MSNKISDAVSKTASATVNSQLQTGTMLLLKRDKMDMIKFMHCKSACHLWYCAETKDQGHQTCKV